MRRCLRFLERARAKAWDAVHGVDTCGEVPLAAFAFTSENKTPGLAYHSHHPKITRAALSGLDIKYKDYVFVDFGCGKGRVLLLALEFPFRRVIGVEFVPELAAIANRNLASYRGRAGDQSRAEVIVCDATRFLLPPYALVLHFYQPFRANVMEQIFNNIKASIEQAPRDLLLLYSGSSTRDTFFAGRPEYVRLSRGRFFDLHRYAHRTN